jgi:hypothetical protein
MRDLELDATRRKRDLVMRDSQSGYAAQAAILDAELASAIAELNQGLDVVLTMNEPSVHVQGFAGELLRIATARSSISSSTRAHLRANRPAIARRLRPSRGRRASRTRRRPREADGWGPSLRGRAFRHSQAASRYMTTAQTATPPSAIPARATSRAIDALSTC